MVPNASVTTPHRAHLLEGNRCGRRVRSWGNRWDMSLTHASLPHMMTWGVTVMAPKSKRRDVTLQNYASRSKGSEPKAAQVLRDSVLASDRVVAASRINPRAGTSRDDR
jgi:hypothetical protein